LTARLTVCGLGPGGSDRVTAATVDALQGADALYLRTSRHPTASLAPPTAATFDHLYDRAESFAEVYRQIAETLVEAAFERPEGGVVYAVPGSPLVLESSVRRLQADDRVELDVLPSLSFLDEVWARLGIDPVEESVRLIDGHQFAVQAASERGPLLVAHVHDRWVLSDIKLAIDAGDEQRAVVLQRLGTDDEHIAEVSWPDLDRLVEPDHLTSLYLPEVIAPVGQELARTVALMHRLRQQCPWDREQTHDSLRPYLVEETYEVLDALEAVGMGASSDGAGYEHLEEELGDLWFQILFHAELATEAGQFTIADVARSVHQKMVRRHPHVFTELQVAGPDDVVANWERIKDDEKQRSSALDGIPTGLPALALAAKLLSRAAKAGAAADPGALGRRLEAVLPADAGGDDFGRVLLAVVRLAQDRGIEPEDALRRATLAAARRFRAAEERGRNPGIDWALG